ncbi:MAG: peptidoglycan-binding protein, partial [Pararhizobium sp.]
AVLEAMGSGGAGADFAASAKWFRQAADHGVKDSQFNLAILYAQGNGVPRDLAQSYKWFAIAALAGDKDAAEKRDEVAKALKPGELDAMKTAVKAWKPIPLDPVANNVPVPPEWAGTDTKTSSIDMSKAIRNIQAILDNNGFDAGKPDGIMGARTKSAIKAFQKSVGQEPTGEISDALIKELLALNAKHAGKTDKKS